MVYEEQREEDWLETMFYMVPEAPAICQGSMLDVGVICAARTTSPGALTG